MSLQSFKLELLSRVDIVDVVERHVALRKAGANFSACCPFHSEKTPSFTVSPSKQFYHCFGCGAHGNAIDFVMQYGGIEFMEALEELARHVGLEVPRFSREQAAKREERAPLTELMGRAARFYREQLKASPKAIDYLKGRGLSGEIAARFGLGYAPDDWQGLQRVFDDYADPALAECGLVIVNEQGRRYDRFRDRVMFPILDQRANVIGFGGRVIGDGEPKYLNSPETPLFEKGRELYGLPQARQAVRDADTVIVVEGYMDVVALAQHGVGNAVATLGTATTAMHVQKLLRQASRVVFCFDGDQAGRKAAWRALEASLDMLADDKAVGFLFLPPEHDPDSFVRAEGAEAFRQLVARPVTLSEFLLRVLKNRNDLGSAEGRSKLVHEAAPLLGRIGAPVLRVQVSKAIADAAAMTQAEVAALAGLKPFAPDRSAPARMKARPAARPIEHALLEAVLHRPEWSVRLPLELLRADVPEGAALIALADAVEHGELPAGGVGRLTEFFRGTPHEAVIAALAAPLIEGGEAPAELETLLNDAVERLRHGALTSEIQQLTAKARQGLSGDEKARLTELLHRKGTGGPSTGEVPF